MPLSGMKVAVVGGGIGGMAAAAVLARRGARVRVHEQAAALGEVGAGLQISANGQGVLRALEVSDVLRGSATVALGTRMLDGRSGRPVTTVPPPRTGPTWYLHRADLLAALAQAAERAGVVLDLGRVAPPGEIEADLIVAADGGRSAWRVPVDGPVDARFTRQVAWRALVEWTSPPLPQMAQLFMGSGAHVVIYPLRQGRLVNVVAVEERADWREEGWTRAGDPDEFRVRFAAFGGLAGHVISAAKSVHVWALHLRPVARRWSDGNVALLGDAAHPTLPFMAQGACLALEDAWVLGAVLEEAPGMEQGLARYQELRQTRAERVVALAKGNAWRFHLPRPWSWGAEAALRIAGGRLAQRLEWVYAYDATKTVSGPSRP